jgi:hypothetical protein
MKLTLSAPRLFILAILAATALVATTAFLSAPAFASGYDPLPSYEPIRGVPVSQRGPSLQTLAVQCRTASADACAYGDASDTRPETGGTARTHDAQSSLPRSQ